MQIKIKTIHIYDLVAVFVNVLYSQLYEGASCESLQSHPKQPSSLSS